MSNNLIDTYLFCDDIINQHKSSQFANVDELLKLANEFSIHYTKLKQNLPYHINVIDELHVNENANSRILSSLLQYEEGGDFPLLKSFIDFCLPDYWEIDVLRPIITTEEQRIDFLIREKNKYAIIFENKIYDAVLQKNQLARYIQKMRSEGFEDRQIHVVFLPPKYYEPDICSWQEPQIFCDTCDRSSCRIGESPLLREMFKDRFKVITFREDIINWLKKETLPNCKYKEVYLYSAMMQYVDYLEGYFDLRTINKKMNMELKDFLFEKLQLNNLTEEEKIKVIDEKIKEIDSLQNNIKNIKEDIISSLATRDADVWKSYFPRLKDITYKVAQKNNIEVKTDFINDDDTNSHFYIQYFKQGWELSIIIEKYDYRNQQSVFVYIGKPGEQGVASNYCSQKTTIFRNKSYPNSHPYGWEWVDKYNAKPVTLREDIDNGDFESYLEQEVGNILIKIDENKLPMK